MTTTQQRPATQIATMQGFSMTMIERYLNSVKVKYNRPEDDYFALDLSYQDDWGCALTFFLGAEGENKNIYSIKCLSDRRIPKNNWGNALVLCNTWNNDWRFPRALLYVQDPDKSTTGNIILDFHLPLTKGVHQELINDISHSIITGGMQFWKWATLEQEF